jgi:drug/metabolite transporter (DMT)-like permease
MCERVGNWKLILNFACVCCIWGSTFLAVKYAINGIPPFVVTSVRYLVASIALCGISRCRNEPWLTQHNVQLAGVSGILLALGNALVCFSETWLPSGLVAVVIGSLPAWIVLMDWRIFGGKAPRWAQVLGILISLIGVAALTQSQSRQLGPTHWLIWIGLFSSMIFWSFGTLTQRLATQNRSIFLFSATQSGVGGLMIGVATVCDGSIFFRVDQVPVSAIFAVGYLAIAGTVVAATSYVWLSQNGDPHLVSTYALITPVVAVWLGWLVVGEAVFPSTLANSLLVVVGVGLILLTGQNRNRAREIPRNISFATEPQLVQRTSI